MRLEGWGGLVAPRQCSGEAEHGAEQGILQDQIWVRAGDDPELGCGAQQKDAPGLVSGAESGGVFGVDVWGL